MLPNRTTPAQDEWFSPPIPLKRLGSQPFGTAYIHPSDAKHGVSNSIPTWDSIRAFYESSEEWKRKNLEWCYPRFFINRPIQELADKALQRLRVMENEAVACLLFPVPVFAQDCARHIVKEVPGTVVEIVNFQTPKACNEKEAKLLDVASFSMAVFPKEAMGKAMMFWINVGGGLTTRHADFAKDYISHLQATSSNEQREIQPLQTIDTLSALPWIQDIKNTESDVKSAIASLSTPVDASLPVITASHVTLYPTGMNAIYYASEALEAVATTSTVVAFGWVYSETIYNLKHDPWKKFIGYERGSEQDLEHLSARLKAGERIGALFCEIPGNVLTHSVQLQRLRALADEYGFPIACDDTVGGFVNLDLMPYVDVMMTSLTKMFSGYSDVTGGSVIVNPASRHFETVQSALQARYEPSFMFPLDTLALKTNSQQVRWRSQRCNENALEIAKMLHNHPLVKRLHYPYFDESLPTYQSLMRRDGGYGSVMSIVFHDARLAHNFYDVLDIPKGASFGTNFTIAIPFALLVHYLNLDEVAEFGLPEHIIRISIGLEDVEEVKAAIQAALSICSKSS